MKKLILASICLATLVGCQDNKSKVDNAVSAERDSLNKVIAQKDNEINDMMSTFNQIEEGLREISQAEGRITVARNGEGRTRPSALPRTCSSYSRQCSRTASLSTS